jgi:hypothetical protein
LDEREEEMGKERREENLPSRRFLTTTTLSADTD